MAEPVTVTCYGRRKNYKTRRAAMNFFMEGMNACDPSSSEYERYSTVYNKLYSGLTEVDDQ
jgi:hypothetical protein